MTFAEVKFRQEKCSNAQFDVVQIYVYQYDYIYIYIYMYTYTLS